MELPGYDILEPVRFRIPVYHTKKKDRIFVVVIFLGEG